MKYEEKKSIVIDYITKQQKKTGIDFYSPTEIGNLFGRDSSFGSPICKKMVEEGILERNNRGWYKLK